MWGFFFVVFVAVNVDVDVLALADPLFLKKSRHFQIFADNLSIFGIIGYNKT